MHDCTLEHMYMRLQGRCVWVCGCGWGGGDVIVVVVVVEHGLPHVVLRRVALLLIVHRRRDLVQQLGQTILGAARSSLVARRLVEAHLCICECMCACIATIGGCQNTRWHGHAYCTYLAYGPATLHLPRVARARVAWCSTLASDILGLGLPGICPSRTRRSSRPSGCNCSPGLSRRSSCP